MFNNSIYDQTIASISVEMNLLKLHIERLEHNLRTNSTLINKDNTQCFFHVNVPYIPNSETTITIQTNQTSPESRSPSTVANNVAPAVVNNATPAVVNNTAPALGVPVAENNEILDDINDSDDQSIISSTIQNSDRSTMFLREKKKLLAEKLIEHYNEHVHDGNCNCGAKRDARCKKITIDRISYFKQHITKHKDLEVHREFYELYIKPTLR